MTHSDLLAARTKPGAAFSLRQLVPTLVFDVALPILVFFVLTSHGVVTPRRAHGSSWQGCPHSEQRNRLERDLRLCPF
jgi:hypothetical protein